MLSGTKHGPNQTKKPVAGPGQVPARHNRTFGAVMTHGGEATVNPLSSSLATMKPRRDTRSHLGFSVGMTGFEPATP